MLSGILKAKTFGDVYDAIHEANKVTPLQVPKAEQQLSRIVGAIFTMEIEGEFAAPTAGRLMYEVAIGVVAMALNQDTEDYRPLRWEMIKPDDRVPVYVSALLCAVRPHIGDEAWSILGGKLFSHWAKTRAFPEKELKKLEERYKELTDECANRSTRRTE